jgi:type IV pilus assembly protein PilB
MLIINELVRAGVINDLIARDAELSFTNGETTTIDEALLQRGVQGEVLRAKRAEMYGLSEYTKSIFVDPEAASLVPEEIVRRTHALPIETVQKRDHVLVGIVDPEIPDALDILQTTLGAKNARYRLVVITYQQFLQGLDSYLSSQKVQMGDESIKLKSPSMMLEEVTKDVVKKDDGEEEDLDLTTIDGTITPELKNESVGVIVNTLIRHAIDESASDIHIEPGDKNMRVRMRIDGILEEVISFPAYIEQTITARFKILSNMRLDEKRKPQDGRFSSKLDNHKVDFRVSVMPSYYGEKVVIRILDSFRGVKPLNEIGFSEAHLKDIRRALERPYGMVLISGPTGSGKTTTLYSMLNEIDRKTRNVVSLEDPVEYNLGDVTQSQIFPEIGYTFATGLRSILRQDPDVIMVGEIRDAETAQLAIQAALTGHLVFSTIHTNNAAGVVSRLKDMNVDPYLIAPTLCLAVAQRLVRKISPSSENPLVMDPAKKALIDEVFKDYPEEFKKDLKLDRPLHEAIPYPMSPTGLKGRIPVVETMYIEDDIQEAILNNKTDDELWALAAKRGAISIQQDAVLKSMDGLVPFVEINSL